MTSKTIFSSATSKTNNFWTWHLFPKSIKPLFYLNGKYNSKGIYENLLKNKYPNENEYGNENGNENVNEYENEYENVNENENVNEPSYNIEDMIYYDGWEKVEGTNSYRLKTKDIQDEANIYISLHEEYLNEFYNFISDNMKAKNVKRFIDKDKYVYYTFENGNTKYLSDMLSEDPNYDRKILIWTGQPATAEEFKRVARNLAEEEQAMPKYGGKPNNKTKHKKRTRKYKRKILKGKRKLRRTKKN